MTGQEIEDLRVQMNWTKDDFARRIGIPRIEYDQYVKRQVIQNAGVIINVQQVEFEIERQNLEDYGQMLSSQPTGPFATGKIFSHLDEIAALKRDPQGTHPITVEWHLSNRCNHDCPFCTFRESVHDSHSPYHNAEFPKQLIGKVIEDLKDLGVKAVVHSGGGEPLLCQNVNEVMKAVKAAGIHQGLITNGANIDKPEIAEAIIETCDWVRISVDAGSPEVYEETHGRGRDFEKIIENIKQLVQQRRKGPKPRIGVSFLLTMLNFTDLLPSARHFKRVGVDYFQVKPIVISAQERLASGNIFWRKEIFNQLVALPAQADIPRYRVYTLGFKFVDMMRAIHSKPFRKCYGHPFYPVISATGDIYVCCLMIGEGGLCYGKVDANTGFKELWDSPKRLSIGESVNIMDCPVNCKLSETNKVLEEVLGKQHEDKDFLN